MNPSHLIEPGAWFLVAVGFDWVEGEFPVLFFELDQALTQTDDVLGDDIVVLQPVKHQEVSLQTLCVVDWG